MKLNRYTCEDCIWVDDCHSNYTCEYFSPSDENIDDLIEEERFSFREEWNEYIEDRG